MRTTARSFFSQGKRARAFLASILLIVALLASPTRQLHAEESATMRIFDWKTGECYVEAHTRVGAELFFGWIHSQEKIPWNEYFHIDENGDLILDAITFPAFGAGIPENKGEICYVDENGLIHMERIDQKFEELVWLNSHTATQDIRLDGTLVARGRDLPQHTRLRLIISVKERGDVDGPKH
ncbi:DUF1850 domain-containing protein [Synergistaceae bacterium OttesenSCG-928-I11]|nr:DUF1850 domain-containing protein [Synergistaceae bacterium OttesenSCG-928-I11]